MTEPSTLDVDRVAVAQVGVSGRNAFDATSVFWLRILVNTDDGASWEVVSSRASPQDTIALNQHGAVSYTDAISLEAGTTYRFAVRPLGANLQSAWCNLVVTASAGGAAQMPAPAEAAEASGSSQ